MVIVQAQLHRCERCDMWPFNTKPKTKKKASAPRKPPAPLVAVVYREPSYKGTPTTDPAHGYVYKWAAPSEPRVGARVMAPVDGRGDVHAVVIAVNVRPPAGYTRRDLSTITRPA